MSEYTRSTSSWRAQMPVPDNGFPTNSDSSFVDLDSGAQSKSRFGFLRGRKKSSDARDSKNNGVTNVKTSPPPLLSSRSMESLHSSHGRGASVNRALPPVPPIPVPQRVPSESSSHGSTPNSTRSGNPGSGAYNGSFVSSQILGPLRLSPQSGGFSSPPTRQSSRDDQGLYNPYADNDLPNPFSPSDSQQGHDTSMRRPEGLPKSSSVPLAPRRRHEGLPSDPTQSSPPSLPPLPRQANLSQQFQSSPQYTQASQPQFVQSPPRGQIDPVDRMLDRHKTDILDGVHMSDSVENKLAEGIVISAGFAHITGQSDQDRKRAMENLKQMTLRGTKHMAEATEMLHGITASPAWAEGKEIAETMLEPAKDVMVILDAAAAYIPMLLAAKAVFTAIVKVELDRHENDKNVNVVWLTMCSFWLTLCDLKVVFMAPVTVHQRMAKLVDDVNKKMDDFGNFANMYYKQHHMTRTIHSGSYKTQLTDFANAFKEFENTLQHLLTESSALMILKVDENVEGLSTKLDQMMSMIQQVIERKSPLEENIEREVEQNGGREVALKVALKDRRFLMDMAKEYFGTTLTPQLRTALQMDIKESLENNRAIFTLQLEEKQKEIKIAMDRSTDTIIKHMDSGPHELIKDEDIRELWKSMVSFVDFNWRMSCKTRHFVDALYHHFATRHSEHRRKTGEFHNDQWTLKFMGKVIFQPTIGDAVDEYGSGYVSVHEINRFVESRRSGWSVEVLIAYCAAGWYQNAAEYQRNCISLLEDIEHRAKRMLRPNRKYFGSYFSIGCLPELWTIVNSLNTDTFRYRGTDMRTEYEALGEVRAGVMDATMKFFQDRLESVKYRINTAEEVNAIMGTTRVEVFILPLLCTVLERHAKILELAENLVLSEREFQTMITSVQSLAFAFGLRYYNLVAGWRQQRLDVSRQVMCFSSGIFESWHSKFHEFSIDEIYPIGRYRYNDPSWKEIRVKNEEKSTARAVDLLVYGLPEQPPPEKMKNLRHSAHLQPKAEDGWAKDRYGHASQRVRSKTIRRSHRRSGVPTTPTIKINERSKLRLDIPSTPTVRGPQSPSFSPSKSRNHRVEHSEDDDGYESVDSADLPELIVEHRKVKPLRLEDKIKSVEAELGGIKDMLAQLLAMSSRQNGRDMD
ncbi:hypothetical protein K435DRAFT_838050 [Dendrothele bispora CBS 962.96]|uniref:EF-hand domain-containing protein n=1 Tax=Dendrothele bispora (strain CBS 962.96) TaxID=1314807 RepID=A0A4S8M9Q9_DENBC|nr:hypothetical protein K435DRAFT_838050 [Dendrothele bispora CBS 962.96]